MDNPNRRSFLSRAILGASALWGGKWVSGKDSAAGMHAAKHPVQKIKAMGFQWETRDPFLFCAHPKDDYPKGNDICGPAVSVKDCPLGDDFIIKDGFRM